MLVYPARKMFPNSMMVNTALDYVPTISKKQHKLFIENHIHCHYFYLDNSTSLYGYNDVNNHKWSPNLIKQFCLWKRSGLLVDATHELCYDFKDFYLNC